MDKVLVLMATYNGEKYLQAQLDSLYRQIGVDVSILVRDDGSTDSTIDILEENSKIHDLKWYTGKHLNVAYGFFDLMEKAISYDAPYYAFCDQDDVWDADKLTIAVNEIRDINTAALYYSGQRLVDDNLKFIENHYLNAERSVRTRFVLSDFAGCTGVFNRKLLDEVVSFRPEYMLMHDTWILRVCLALGGSVKVDTKPRISYRQHSNNTLGLGHSLSATIKQVRQYIFEYHIEKLTRELLRGYGSRMVSDYFELSSWICGYRRNKCYRKKLLDKNIVNFCNKGLNITYRLKVYLNRL